VDRVPDIGALDGGSDGAGAARGGRRIRLTLEYDGARFSGWQRQPEDRTVQGEMESALARLIGADVPLRVAAAGRTDRGVHATGQVISIAGLPDRWTPGEIVRALNAVLPVDVRARHGAEAEGDFHARFSAIARGYVYRVATVPHARSPFIRRWSWPFGAPLPLEVLGALAGEITGTHRFRAFAKSGQPQRGYACTVHRSEWREWTYGVAYHVVANRFLHHMVRYLVGTMVEAASGGRAQEDIAALLRAGANENGAGAHDQQDAQRGGGGGVVARLESKPGRRPGRPLQTSRPAPPEGLFLSRVYYPGDSFDGDLTDEILS
jgi:tRNA pseudouridine38-40 synthase